ncbi:MAG: hypothetical protein SFY95_12565 [Planctomycetota bacterium]|nr:hypothetical protein [Planctomycetota bacterium]
MNALNHALAAASPIAGDLALLVALGGLGVGVGAGLVWLAWKLWAAPASQRRGAGDDAALHQTREQTQELRRVARDARELTRILARELDARAEKLTTLLAEADGVQAPRPREATRAVTRSAAGEVEPPEVVVRSEAARGLLDPSHAEVHELADRGLSAVEIAKRLGRPPGQVELILALRKAAARS